MKKQQTKRRIGIYGGTFDPIHVGHLLVAEQARVACQLDEVRFLPAGNPPHKHQSITPSHHRAEMIARAIADHPAFSLDRRELEKDTTSYSYDTIAEMQAEAPSASFFFLMGEDSFLTLESWYRWRDLLALVPVIVHSRPLDAEQARRWQDRMTALRAQGYHLEWIDTYAIQVSASTIRADLQAGRSVRYLLPESVYAYIEREGLYGVAAPEASVARQSAAFLRAVRAEDLHFLEEAPYAARRAALQKALSPHRYAHSLGVVQTARYLAKRYGVDVSQASMAALLHDCAKKSERALFDQLARDGHLDGLTWKDGPTFHAALGARVARWIYGIDDAAVCQAIAAHTMGTPQMHPLDQVLYLADAIEPSRSYPGVDALRALAQRSLEEAVLATMNHTLQYLLEEDAYIEMGSLVARNAMWEARHRPLPASEEGGTKKRTEAAIERKTK